jgi:hypothetical protein
MQRYVRSIIVWNVKVIENYGGFEVPTAVVMKSSLFWDITPFSPLKVNRRSGETRRLHLQGRRISQARTRIKAGGKESLAVLPKRLLTFNGLHCVICQKMELFVIMDSFYSCDIVMLGLRPRASLMHQALTRDGLDGGMIISRGKSKCSEKNVLSTTLSITNPTWPALGPNPCLLVRNRRLTAWDMVQPTELLVMI